jgi:hypothetical protein
MAGEAAVRLDYEPQRNLLLLAVEDGPPATASVTVPGLVDMAAAGRLIGVEARLQEAEIDPGQTMTAWLTEAGVSLGDGGALYIELTSGPDDDYARSIAVELLLASDAAGQVVAIGIPRRGAGYEISYPSGNR